MAAERKEGGTGSNAMEQFLVLANSAKGLGAVELIKSVLGQSTVFSFGELIEHPNIKALDSTEFRPWLTVLKIFAYGTYHDYKSSPAGSVPELNPKQLTKLKQLTIVSKASVAKTLTYAQLMQELDVANVRELEDLIIDCIYSDLIVGKLDQKRMVLDVQYANACDIGPQDISSMTARLASWISSSDEVLTALEQQMKVAEEGFKTRVKEAEELKKSKEEVEAKVKQQMEKAAQKRQGAASEQDGAMMMQMQMQGLSGAEWAHAAAGAFFGGFGGKPKKPAARTVK